MIVDSAVPRVGDHVVIDRDGLDAVISALRADGRRVIGPVRRDGAIVHDDIEGVADLPAGWGDTQDGGTYRLERRGDEALFGFAAPSESWKRHLYPPKVLTVRSRRTADGFDVQPVPVAARPLALVGVRSCDLHAIAIHDRVLLHGVAVDPAYAARRADVLVVAVHCGTPGGTCFCTSMGTGPKADAGFDLALTELVGEWEGEGRHELVVEIATLAGADLVARVPHRPATPDRLTMADQVITGSAAAMGRHLEPAAPRRAAADLDHPRWDAVAERCLACANCTMVCPTCFCSASEDHTSLDGQRAERSRRWASCFELDFSYLHGGAVRSTTKSRYRQWLLHKLVTWEEQFGTSGCVGCGRCITWCPVGIDLTAEIAALAERSEGGPRADDP